MSIEATIITLMRQNSNALGFIPHTQLKRRWIDRQLYVPIQPRGTGARGYLLHGPPKPGRPLSIHQICVDQDYRLNYHASAALNTLIQRANQHQASLIRLRCASDLEANLFWLSVGFRLVATNRGGKARGRQINEYHLQLREPQPPTPTPTGPGLPWWAGVRLD